jgi:hypothetical protein
MQSLIEIPAEETAFIQEAAKYLESPSFLMRIADLVGEPLQKIGSAIVPSKVAEYGNDALNKVMTVAISTIPNSQPESEIEKGYLESGWQGLWHRLAVTVTGGIGGAFGLPGLAIELPVTTAILFRSIAAIAVEYGENLSSPEVRMECLSVFCHGGPGKYDDAMESSYITSRLAMTALIEKSAEFIAGKSAEALSEAIAKGTAPALINLMNKILSQFNIAVSQKFIAQSLPIISIASGAAINNAFAGHFNSVAKYHFGIRKLERRYGHDLVKEAYNQQRKLFPKR